MLDHEEISLLEEIKKHPRNSYYKCDCDQNTCLMLGKLERGGYIMPYYRENDWNYWYEITFQGEIALIGL